LNCRMCASTAAWAAASLSSGIPTKPKTTLSTVQKLLGTCVAFTATTSRTTSPR
jgi:hypothetical protein